MFTLGLGPLFSVIGGVAFLLVVATAVLLLRGSLLHIVRSSSAKPENEGQTTEELDE